MNVFKRYNVRRDDVQADALARQQAYLEARRGTSAVERIRREVAVTHREGTTTGHDGLPC